MKTAVVTGASGFVGRYLITELLYNGVQVIAVIRNKSRENVFESHNNLSVVCCPMNQISSLPGLIMCKDFEIFYHFAWEGTSGDARADEHLQAFNAVQTVEAVRVAKQLGCKRFVGAGSLMEKEVIDATFTQECKSNVGHIYSAGKLMAHCASKAVAAQIGIDHIWGIITNAYGAGETSSRFLNTTLRKIINNEPLTFTSATQNYDFIYVSDVARAFFLIGEKGLPFCNYTIGSGNAKPLREFIIEIQQQLAPNREFLFGDVPFTGTSLPLSNFDITNLITDVGFKPEISFESGIKKTISWLKNDKYLGNKAHTSTIQKKCISNNSHNICLWYNFQKNNAPITITGNKCNYIKILKKIFIAKFKQIA